MILNYFGSKTRLINTLDRVICPLMQHSSDREARKITFGDYFAGTGFVGNHYRAHDLVQGVVSCDQELYSYILNKALMTTTYTPKLERIIVELNANAPLCKGLIWDHFSPGGAEGRKFFTIDNAMRIDGIRVAIHEMHKTEVITYDELLFLLASLFRACSRAANVASCFRAYLKNFTPRSTKPLVLVPIHTLRDETVLEKKKKVKVLRGDILGHAGSASGPCANVDIVYLDPPYNACHYGGYYGFYNYLAIYTDRYKLNGVGVPENYNKSSFGFRDTCVKSLSSLIGKIAETARTQFVVMSYNSDGAMSKADIVGALGKQGNVTLFHCRNAKFKTHLGVKEKFVQEYIFVCHLHSDRERPYREIDIDTFVDTTAPITMDMILSS